MTGRPMHNNSFGKSKEQRQKELRGLQESAKKSDERLPEIRRFKDLIEVVVEIEEIRLKIYQIETNPEGFRYLWESSGLGPRRYKTRLSKERQRLYEFIKQYE